MTSGWTNALAHVLQPPSNPHPDAPQRPGESPRKSRNPAGRMWKHALYDAVHSDLSLGIHGVRRFVRLERLGGLSGIILYTLPRSASNSKNHGHIELDCIFGNEGCMEDGMSEDVLADAVQARLVYFPAYACTSFTIGQVMNALIHSESFKPDSLPHGFAVDVAPFASFSKLDYTNSHASYPSIPALDFSSINLLKKTQHLMKEPVQTHVGVVVVPGTERVPYSWRELVAHKIAKKKMREEQEARARAAQEAEDENEVDETLLDSDSADDTVGPETPLDAFKSTDSVFKDSDVGITPLCLPLSSNNGKQSINNSGDVFGGDNLTAIVEAGEKQVRISMLLSISSFEGGLQKTLKSTSKENHGVSTTAFIGM